MCFVLLRFQRFCFMIYIYIYKTSLQAESPTEKSIRACYKAGIHLCTIYDASYIRCIELCAASKQVVIDMLTNNNLVDAQASHLQNTMYVRVTRRSTNKFFLIIISFNIYIGFFFFFFFFFCFFLFIIISFFFRFSFLLKFSRRSVFNLPVI